jgi:septum formation protein
MHFILASKSPRRKEILENLGVQFEIITADTDESADVSSPEELVEVLSLRKARAVCEKLKEEGRELSHTVVIASDTVVAMEGEILGKPKDESDARRMLSMLSGKSHKVVSGICLMSADKTGVGHEVTYVEFDPLDEETITRYIQTTNPYDKAGAYAIQGSASAFIGGIRGCYFNVVGLPVHRLCTLYRQVFGENFL